MGYNTLMAENHSFALLFQSRDRKGIVAGITDFIFKKGGNILAAEQYSTDPSNGHFFIRVEFFISDGGWSARRLSAEFAPFASDFDAIWSIADTRERMRMGILVTKPDHCLYDLLYLWRSGELNADISFVLTNCEAHRPMVEQFGIPFYFVPSSKEDRMEDHLLALVKGACDFLVLARYMLTLSRGFLDSYGKDIINIHHGFLPSFKGARPYHQAHAQGVKVIGATAHFVTEKLDEGPIICQKVEPVSHKDSVQSLMRKGKNLEKDALSSAVVDYADHRVIRFGGKTIVFSAT